jgi:hypothetical protein
VVFADAVMCGVLGGKKTGQDHEDGACEELLAVIALNTTCACVCVHSQNCYGMLWMYVYACAHVYISIRQLRFMEGWSWGFGVASLSCVARFASSLALPAS